MSLRITGATRDEIVREVRARLAAHGMTAAAFVVRDIVVLRGTNPENLSAEIVLRALGAFRTVYDGAGQHVAGPWEHIGWQAKMTDAIVDAAIERKVKGE